MGARPSCCRSRGGRSPGSAPGAPLMARGTRPEAPERGTPARRPGPPGASSWPSKKKADVTHCIFGPKTNGWKKRNRVPDRCWFCTIDLVGPGNVGAFFACFRPGGASKPEAKNKQNKNKRAGNEKTTSQKRNKNGPEKVSRKRFPKTMFSASPHEMLQDAMVIMSSRQDSILFSFWLSEKPSGSQDMSIILLGPRPGGEVSYARVSCIGDRVYFLFLFNNFSIQFSNICQLLF